MTKILLVEDNRIMLDLLKTLLEIEGFQIICLTLDGEFIPAIKIEEPDIILLDVHLRDDAGYEVSGFDLLQDIREEADLKHLHVLMSSGSDLSKKCLHEGAHGFIQKPYLPGQLIDKIKEIMIHASSEIEGRLS
jgi:CheY-like chemotaxis protein